MQKRIGIYMIVIGALIFCVSVLYNIKGSLSRVEVIETYNGTAEYNNSLMPKWFAIGGHYDLNDYQSTPDGGWVFIGRPAYSANVSEIYKYDKDGALEWSKILQFHAYDYAYNYVYTDGFKENYSEGNEASSRTGGAKVIAVDDGYYVTNDSSGLFVKLDLTGEIVWQNEQYWSNYIYEMDEVCNLDGNTDGDGNVLVSFDHGSKSYYGLSDYMRRDDTTYYCNVNIAQSQFNELANLLTPIQNNKILSLAKIDYGNFIRGNEKYPITSGLQLMVYDHDGNFETIKSLSPFVIAASNAYKEKYNITSTDNPEVSDYFWSLQTYPDNSILLVESSFAIKFKYNEQTRDFETIWYTPLGINGKQLTFYGNNDGILNVKLTDDGGFTILQDGVSDPVPSSSVKPYYNGSNLQYDVSEFNYDWTTSTYFGRYIYAFKERTTDNGKEAYLGDMTLINYNGYRRFEINFDENDNPIIGTKDINYLFDGHTDASNFLPAYEILPDGTYIVGTPYKINPSSAVVFVCNATNSAQDAICGQYGANNPYTIRLADGSFYTIKSDTNYIVYNVNKDGTVNWIKEYKLQALGGNQIINKAQISLDKKQVMIPYLLYPGYTVTNQSTNEVIYTAPSSDVMYHAFMTFDLGYDREERVIPDPEPDTPETPDDPEPDTPEEKDEDKKQDEEETKGEDKYNPKTGDESNYIFIALLVGLTGFVITSIYLKHIN